MEGHLLHRKEKIILTSIDILDELGIQGLSTREIAKRQGISEGTLFRHFKSKLDILLAVLEYFSQYDNDIMQSIRIKALKPKEAIIYFIKAYVEYYENYKAITSITQAFGIFSCDPDLAGRIKDIYSKRTEFIKALIDEAQKSGEIRQDIDSEDLADVITGTFLTICLKWRLEKYSFPLKDRTLSSIGMVLDSF